MKDYVSFGTKLRVFACAERAGVFGPVDIAAPPPVGPKEPPPPVPCGPLTPTCAGPLATHGTPVLRVMSTPLRGNHQEMMCDGCYLFIESLVADAQGRLRDNLRTPNSEPPARIGTVPQVVSVGVGIWASRGMRR